MVELELLAQCPPMFLSLVLHVFQRRRTKEKSSKGIYVVLVVMVVITWAIAATAYFGVINYKALLGKANSIGT